MTELEPTQLHWLYEENPFEDLCAHGGVYLNINGTIVSDGLDKEWTLSTASYYLLKTVWSDYKATSDTHHLIPCCGHSMWKDVSFEDGIYIVECTNGINWEIKHQGEKLTHRFPDGTTLETDAVEWKKVVCEFSKKVIDFFVTASPKVCSDEYEREGFEIFMRQWLERFDRACKS